MYGGSMFQPAPFGPFADMFAAPFGAAGGRAPPFPDAGLKSLGAATRTAWSIGIEWYDYVRQSQDLAVTAAGRIAAARSAAEAFGAQTTYLRAVGELNAARMPVFFELSRTLLNDLARIPAGRGG